MIRTPPDLGAILDGHDLAVVERGTLALLQGDVERLTAELARVAAERDTLATYNGELVAERDSARVQAGALAEERDRAARSWRCFQCGDVFTEESAARDHFSDGHERPGCVDPLRSDERARLNELRDAREYARNLRRELDDADNDRSLFRAYQEEIGRLFGECGGVIASTPHQAWLKYESLLGRVEASEAQAQRQRRALLRCGERIRSLREQVLALRQWTLMKPSDVCRRHHFQACSHCDALDCGDNTSEARAERDRLRALLERVARELFVPLDRLDDVPAHVEGLGTERDEYKAGEAEACLDLARVTEERDRLRARVADQDRAPAEDACPDSLRALWSSQSEWSQATFGVDGVRGPVGALKHLQREAAEAAAAPDDATEYADCFLLILDAARRAGLDLDALIGAARAKHEVNRRRTWPTPTSDEPVEHVRGDDPAPAPRRDLTPECPGPDCPLCNGAACAACGAGLCGRPTEKCEHDVIERHQEPAPAAKEER